MARGILLNARNHGQVPRDEYDEWYQTEHLLQRSRIPGFLGAERWVAVHDPHVSVAFYDLASVDVLASEAYRAVAYENNSPWTKRIVRLSEGILRFEGTQTLPGEALSPSGSGGLLVNAMSATPEGDAELNRWYDEEHIPALSAVPGTLLARRYRATRTTGSLLLALYHLESPEVVSSEAWARAVETPWTKRVRPFMRDRVRIVCRPYRQGD
jgi:hypothetical protein